MNATGLSTPGLITTSTGSAKSGGGIDIPLRDFIPPLLLTGTPNLVRAAATASEWHILVIAALHELGGPIAVVRGQSLDIDEHESRWSRSFAPNGTSHLS